MCNYVCVTAVRTTTTYRWCRTVHGWAAHTHPESMMTIELHSWHAKHAICTCYSSVFGLIWKHLGFDIDYSQYTCKSEMSDTNHHISWSYSIQWFTSVTNLLIYFRKCGHEQSSGWLEGGSYRIIIWSSTHPVWSSKRKSDWMIKLTTPITAAAELP